MPLVLEALTTLQCGKTNDVKIPKFLQNKSSVLRALMLTAVLRAIVMASVLDTNDG